MLEHKHMGHGRPRAFLSPLDRLVRLGIQVNLGIVRRAFASEASSYIVVESRSELNRVPCSLVRERLEGTQNTCAEISESYPWLEHAFRRRRRQLAVFALMLVRKRLSDAISAILRLLPAGEPLSFTKRTTILSRGTSLGIYCGLLQHVLAFFPTERIPGIDDRAVGDVLSTVADAERLLARLDRIRKSLEARRKLWKKLFAYGPPKWGNATALSLSPEALSQEVLWASPTRISKLILLSTLRDHNTGIYCHPSLSARLPGKVVSEALADLHNAACEDLLKCSFKDLVYDLGLYGDQTRATRHVLLNQWKKVRAYRVTRSADLDLFSALCFDLTLDFAVAALDSRRD